MSQDASASAPLLSTPTLSPVAKSTLRRRASRRTLALSHRPTSHFFRRKLKRAKCIFVRKGSSSPSVDYFSTRLPAEIRLKVYGYLLQFEGPLRITHGTHGNAFPGGGLNVVVRKRCETERNLGILRASRKIHEEALSVLYELNTIHTRRWAFCTNSRYRARDYPQNTLHHDLVRSLYVDCLQPSPDCSAIMAKQQTTTTSPAPTRTTELPCVYCDVCLLPFIRSLREMPRLKEAFIDYHTRPEAITKLAASLTGTYGQATGLRLTCTGLGKYELSGASWFSNDQIELRDVLLREIWTRVIAFPRPDPANLISSIRATITQHKALITSLRSLTPRFSKTYVKVMVRKVRRIVSYHNLGRVSKGMSDIWPAGLEMDFKVVDECARPNFLHGFNVELQRLCREGMGFTEAVMRRAHSDPLGAILAALGQGQGVLGAPAPLGAVADNGANEDEGDEEA